ncbi:pep-cterm sorting domain-containing protein [Anaeramoeba ignava]|uniref:Pep-cterm sorting domain-containing protein n=1 Tax=Anaeramoeba ignava TaxID=1746090 RepID=A0A9Q0LBA3_ANAIG|nr:pep-cterm sorting domain-containing protein [Anaeramoeba ignava]
MENYSNLEKLSNDLKNLFQNQNEKEEENYFDFEIICEENKTSFKTHKSILSSRSQYFKSLFKSKMKEYQENKLILQDVSSSVLSSILNYFYSGKIEINLENAIQILVFSSKYLIDELIEICSKFIQKNFQIETIVDVLKLSESMNLNELLDFCYQFISENFKEFIKNPFFFELEENHLNSILSNDRILTSEFEIFQTIIKWGKHKSNINQEKEYQKLEKEEKEKIQNQISNVIHKIRFIDFSKKELKNVLKEDLIPNEITQKLIQFQKLQKKPKKNQVEIKQFLEEENQNENSLLFKPRIRFESSIIEKMKDIQKIKEWINDDEFFSKMKLGFSAKRDGFSAKKWHSICDNKGKTLVIFKGNGEYIFGGFTSVGWIQGKNDRFITDSSAFLFSLVNPTNSPPDKYPVKKGMTTSYSVYYNINNGPCFCNVCLGAPYKNLKRGKTGYFGQCFTLPKGIFYKTNEETNYFCTGDGDWQIDELETFFI